MLEQNVNLYNKAFDVKRLGPVLTHFKPVFFFLFSAPEISLNPDGGNREEFFYSDSIGEYKSVDETTERLLPESSRPTNYSI